MKIEVKKLLQFCVLFLNDCPIIPILYQFQSSPMKKVTVFGLIGFSLFEICRVYFIMPMPGSQQMNSIDLAYFLHEFRWLFRFLFLGMATWGLVKSSWSRKWVLGILLFMFATIAYVFNFIMSADAMFKPPYSKVMASPENNKVDSNRLVVGVEINGDARAYPIQFLGYHHFVYDTVGGQPVLVTYCTVCRTGRVFNPQIEGKVEQFRLVGMDHFNAMIEDEATGSWWRQSTGEAIKGERKGLKMKEIFCSQMSLKEWISQHPNSKIMQADKHSLAEYDENFDYENGNSRSTLTGTDTGSWKPKSWVVGVVVGKESVAFDWNELKRKRILSKKLESTTVLLVLGDDNTHFVAFKIPEIREVNVENNRIAIDGKLFTMDGELVQKDNEIQKVSELQNGGEFQKNSESVDSALKLEKLQAYQEFWHSWKTFHPETKKVLASD